MLIEHCRALFVIGGLLALSQSAVADGAVNRRTAMAVENIQLAQSSCGYELSFLARNLITRDRGLKPRPFAQERDVLINLWRQTWACNPSFAGGNCMATRWQLCQRAYAEYGPDGIRMKGLIKAIIKK